MRLLNEPKHTIEHLTVRFRPEAKDVEWLPEIATDPELILISGDPAITTSKKEREIWRQCGMTSYFFAAGFTELQTWKQVIEVVTWWPVIVLHAKDAPRGSGYLLPVKGHNKGPKSIYDPSKFSDR